MSAKTKEYLQSLVRELCNYKTEVEWVEFKSNMDDPENIARYISALSNSATLWGRTTAYLVWGIDDETHNIKGTKLNYREIKVAQNNKSNKKGEELEAWLVKVISPKIDFSFHEVDMDDITKVIVLEIPCAEKEPTKYNTIGYIRVGTTLKPLSLVQEKELELWKLFDKTPYEQRIALENVSEQEVTTILDCAHYYDLMEAPLPSTRKQMIEDLVKEKFVIANDAGNWNITNFGALMIAKDIKKSNHLGKRTIRVIQYKGTDRLNGIREQEFSCGYACCFETVVKYVMSIIPQEEILDGAIRKSVYAFPEIAIREMLANAVIHQALEQRGTNPMVEIFDNRIEFSNSGAPLVSIDRLIDTVPVSRNENIAGFMHKCGICEERGSGFDKIVNSTSKNMLLAPMVVNVDNQFTKAILFSRIPFDLISKEDKIRTCYMQACLAYVKFSSIANADIRAVFGLADKDKDKVSRIIKDTLDRGLIKLVDPKAAPKSRRYKPYWA